MAESNPSPDLGHARSCRHHSCSLRFRRVGLLPLVLMSRPAAVRRRGVRPGASIELIRCGTWAAATKLTRARAPIPIIRRRTTPVNRLAPDRHLARSGSRNEACLRRCLNNWQSWQTALPKLQLNDSVRRRQKSSWTLTRVADCGSRHFPRNAFVRMSALGH